MADEEEELTVGEQEERKSYEAQCRIPYESGRYSRGDNYAEVWEYKHPEGRVPEAFFLEPGVIEYFKDLDPKWKDNVSALLRDIAVANGGGNKI